MASRNGEGCGNVVYNKGAWTAEEDAMLAQYIELHGPKKWKTLAIKSGLNRCGKSCRLRWLNYLRPNIKRGNISSEEEDLIIRLHKLLGNRWSLIAGRIPGRTDNEIKNYWNSHLSKKINREKIHVTTSKSHQTEPYIGSEALIIEQNCNNQRSGEFINFNIDDISINYDVNDFFDFSTEGTYGLDWVNTFLEEDDDQTVPNLP